MVLRSLPLIRDWHLRFHAESEVTRARAVLIETIELPTIAENSADPFNGRIKISYSVCMDA